VEEKNTQHAEAEEKSISKGKREPLRLMKRKTSRGGEKGRSETSSAIEDVVRERKDRYHLRSSCRSQPREGFLFRDQAEGVSGEGVLLGEGPLPRLCIGEQREQPQIKSSSVLGKKKDESLHLKAPLRLRPLNGKTKSSMDLGKNSNEEKYAEVNRLSSRGKISRPFWGEQSGGKKEPGILPGIPSKVEERGTDFTIKGDREKKAPHLKEAKAALMEKENVPLQETNEGRIQRFPKSYAEGQNFTGKVKRGRVLKGKKFAPWIQ